MRYSLAVPLAAWCQLRRGEVLGLQRGDIDLLHGTLRVERAVVLPPGGRPIVGMPKTVAGRRTVSVPPNVLPAAVEHLASFISPEPDAWLISANGGSPISPSTLELAWRQARLAIGRPDLHLHDLRHSGLTWAAATGASTRELMALGGHASPRAALRYQHATEDRDRALVNALAELDLPATVTPIRRSAE